VKVHYRILGTVVVLIFALLAAVAVAISYDADCEAGQPPQITGQATGQTMLAATHSCYGPPEVLTVGEILRPEPGPDEVQVEIRVAAVNPMDWHYMRGSPYFMRLMSGIGRPKDTRLGTDFAGVVTAVGVDVNRFKPGDNVFGGATGAYAEYVVRSQNHSIAHIPEGVSFKAAAAVPIAGLTALQALRDKGQLHSGERVLINGASGGVGTYAVQMAKGMGAEVTGVCSTGNVSRVLALGADHVIDYKQSDYTQQPTQYDLIIDLVGNHSVLANSEVLAPGGRMVIVAGGYGDWVGPMINPLMTVILSPFLKHDFFTLMAEFNEKDLELLANMVASGDLQTVIDRHYPLAEVRDAITYSETGRAKGKIIIDVQ